MDINNSDLREELELALGEQLNSLISEAHALNVRTAATFDTTLQPAAFLIVRWLFSHGPTNASTLAESTAMDRSSISRLIGQLKGLGYVKSEPHPKDRRGVMLSLTELGHDKTIKALKEKESIFFERISGLTDSELKAYIEMLKNLTI
ncbi:MarR family transcriptional regulator [Peribacillus simplex]|jgi:DNA-binding MarR family transcriptional regulator|uniref:MarR family transcriptional regulator n=1 Tax=Peribacillus simplex TaxID=1478 RepID=A0A9X9EQF9_9BACI|nr:MULTISPECIES: MarR family transcriptional regulator [Peribacillus]KOR83577.1 MarR family transcriptional regulator [Bacillus sp. FJAT-22058]KRF58764.1 MarR family transcriptional regulator [Bacillus sp. Soil745]PEF41513.1 MarR family transcriptional regulator [Bacillus sp. AFS094228]QNK46490.1 MarR family transcriptional regulator [Brevibacterium sp. PAMC23299]MCK2021066.1 MarR family transcriptional regulator [Peribacillus frigoritolerans]